MDLAPWRHLLGTGMEMQSRQLRVLRKAATFEQLFAKGIGSSGHGFSPEVVLDQRTKTPWLELTQPDPTQKNFLPPQTEQIPIWSCAMDAKWWQQTQTVSQHVSTCLIQNRNDLLTIHGNRLRKTNHKNDNEAVTCSIISIFLYKILHGKTKIDATPCKAPPRQSDWKHQNRYYLMP